MKRFIPAGLMFLSAVPLLSGLARLFDIGTHSLGLEGHARFTADPVPAVFHIVGATAFATLGALQFSPRLRATRWHRLAGRIIAPLSVLAAFSGAWMALRWPPKEYDSLALNVMRLSAGTTMTAFILVSLWTARRRDFAAHGRWMTRAYALGAAPGTQFFTHIPFMLFESIRGEVGTVVCMGAGWLINVLVAEWVLRPATQPSSSSIMPALPAL